MLHMYALGKVDRERPGKGSLVIRMEVYASVAGVIGPEFLLELQEHKSGIRILHHPECPDNLAKE